MPIFGGTEHRNIFFLIFLAGHFAQRYLCRSRVENNVSRFEGKLTSFLRVYGRYWDIKLISYALQNCRYVYISLGSMTGCNRQNELYSILLQTGSSPRRRRFNYCFSRMRKLTFPRLYGTIADRCPIWALGAENPRLKNTQDNTITGLKVICLTKQEEASSLTKREQAWKVRTIGENQWETKRSAGITMLRTASSFNRTDRWLTHCELLKFYMTALHECLCFHVFHPRKTLLVPTE